MSSIIGDLSMKINNKKIIFIRKLIYKIIKILLETL